MRFGIVVSDWNSEITGALLNGAVRTLKKHGTDSKNIIVKHVPGTFELTLGAQFLAEYDDLDGVICLGCVIQGETPHFNYICQGVTQGITQLNLDYNIPFIFGVLTTNNLQQAADRAGGKLGNKGDEAAITAIKMAALQKEMEK
jgi:6,7-dimethyl-8-ribityllumazine synthase